ncbi:hypothetical protein PCANC_28896 [Puccinia coronata f. sp. avenae]|uniref:HHH domain-containing protein n=1 Tax=Puccinia coronata f. sp. avenae TaxID=200324 RepID=A0A2N5S1Y6_9BASI|nr:hypothetical protein PCANC_28896 [Puccinia coronata f. sp. avenae]
MMSSDDLDPNQTIDPDILDDTRIHPEDYDVARKLADSQELDEEDLNKQPPSQAISDLLASENGNGASNGKLTAVLNSFTHLRKGLLATKAPLNRSIQSGSALSSATSSALLSTMSSARMYSRAFWFQPGHPFQAESSLDRNHNLYREQSHQSLSHKPKQPPRTRFPPDRPAGDQTLCIQPMPENITV